MLPLVLSRALVKQRVVVFLYHLVSDDELPHVKHLYAYKTTAQFREDLQYLKRHFTLIPYDRLVADANLPPRAALVTFDDGYAECDSVARPILLEEGVPAAFFVTTGFLDNRAMFYRNKASLCIESLMTMLDRGSGATLDLLRRRYGQAFPDGPAVARWVKSLEITQESLLDDLSRTLGVDVDDYLNRRRPYLTSDQVRRLASDGFAIGAHGLQHARLRLLPPAEIEQEILGSCQAIMTLTSRAAAGFAFPFSADGIDRAFLRHLLLPSGVVEIMFDTRGVRRDERFMVNRITADSPPADGDDVSNLPRLIRAAYHVEAIRSLRRWRAAGRRRLLPGWVGSSS